MVLVNEKIELLLEKINRKQIWEEMPVFCFTSDVDWASEDVMKEYFQGTSKNLDFSSIAVSVLKSVNLLTGNCHQV